MRVFSFLVFSFLFCSSNLWAQEGYNLDIEGSIKAYAGYYDSGIAGETGHLVSPTEANLQFKVTRGPIEGYLEIEQRQQIDKTTTKRSLTYRQEQWQLAVGTIAPIETLSFTTAGGLKTSGMSPYGFLLGYSVWAEWDGIGIRYMPSEALDLGFTLYSADVLNTDTNANGYSIKKAGNSTLISGKGNLNDLDYRFSLLSSTSDDHQGGEILTHQGVHLGFKQRFDNLSGVFDLTQKVIQSNLDGTLSVPLYNQSTNETALQGIYHLHGGDEMLLTLGSITREYQLASATSERDDYINLVYNLNFTKDGVIQIAYAQEAKSQGTVPMGVEHVRSFFGMGIYTAF